jgi:hypothetical protein
VRQQHLEPCSELPTDLLWYAHAAHTTPTPTRIKNDT